LYSKVSAVRQQANLLHELSDEIMISLGRGALAVALLAIAGFCVFGFMATFEPPGSPALRMIYAAAGLFCLFGIVWAFIPRRHPPG
jgi:hypothetical protein